MGGGKRLVDGWLMMWCWSWACYIYICIAHPCTTSNSVVVWYSRNAERIVAPGMIHTVPWAWGEFAVCHPRHFCNSILSALFVCTIFGNRLMEREFKCLQLTKMECFWGRWNVFVVVFFFAFFSPLCGRRFGRSVKLSDGVRSLAMPGRLTLTLKPNAK